jgi:thymidylate kinase
MVRISLTGAQGTGKSTLARAIADRLIAEGRAVALYEGLGHDVARSGLATGALAGAESVRAFARLHRTREAAAAGALQIFDRCLLDALAYAQVLRCLPAVEFDDLRRDTIASCARLTMLLWLRVTVEYPVQGPLDETSEFRTAVDEAIGGVARQNGITLIEHAIPPDRVDDIASAVAESLAKYRR